MFIPAEHALADTDAMRALIASSPLGTWSCPAAQGLEVHHLPFVLDPGRGPQGTLLGHVSRRNPVWQRLPADARSVVSFLGPQAYVTPGWYPGKTAHGRVVPTWNYVAVHVHGCARAVEEPQALLNLLNRLTDPHEAREPRPWRVADAPAGFIERLLQGIVGIEIPVERLEGRSKASQDEDLDDRHGTVEGLRRRATGADRAMADVVAQALQRDVADAAATSANDAPARR